jgi:NitT/TauT family transport system substrate-binding protein
MAYYAKQMGYFERNGLDAEVSSMANGAAILSAVSGGALDIGSADLVALSYAHTKGLPFTILFPGGLYTAKTPTDALLVPASSTVQKAADLNGKTIAARRCGWIRTAATPLP